MHTLIGVNHRFTKDMDRLQILKESFIFATSLTRVNDLKNKNDIPFVSKLVMKLKTLGEAWALCCELGRAKKLDPTLNPKSREYFCIK